MSDGGVPCGLEANHGRGADVPRTIIALAGSAVALLGAAAPAAAQETTWYWTKARAEQRLLITTAIPAICTGLGRTEAGLPLVNDRDFECLAPQLDGSVRRLEVHVEGSHRFTLVEDGRTLVSEGQAVAGVSRSSSDRPRRRSVRRRR